MQVEEVLEAWVRTAKPKDNLEKEAHEIIGDALEKQIPKQVGYIAGVFGEKYECPECGSALIDTDLFAGHCKWCGQAIKDN